MRSLHIFGSKLMLLKRQNVLKSMLGSHLQLCSSCVRPDLARKLGSAITSSPLPNAGQPTHVTHAHKIKNGEITPGLKKEEFINRRDKLLESLEASSPESDLLVVIIPASPKKFMTDKIPYVFRQDADYLYLSGCLEPDGCILLTSLNKHHESTLFLRGRDPHAELWDGPRTGTSEAPDLFGVDRCFALNEFGTFLRSLLQSKTNVSLWYDYLSNVNQSIFTTIKDVVPSDMALESPRSFIHRLRLYKSLAEQDLMRRTCAVGSEAMIRTMQISHPNIEEGHLFAKVDYEARVLGAQYLAYPPVVAGGPRANIIHYINNNQRVHDGELILMDAGCELDGYTSDITRTWPICGKWSEEQRELYEVLYNLQLELLKTLEERPSLNKLFYIMCRLLGRGLQELGAISSNITNEDELAKVAYSFCPHHVSHYLGMDVHDTGSMSRDLPLQPGMVFTVEPGIYVTSANKNANPRYHGLGMRIEDDVLLTETNVEVLTERCPRHPDELEKIIGTSSS